MLRKILRIRAILVFLLGLMFFYSYAFAQRYDSKHDAGYQGWHNRGYGREYDRRYGGWHDRDIRGHGRYWRDGRWFRHAWFGPDMEVPIFDDVIVSSLPPSCSTVLIRGIEYYFCGNMYFRPIPGGGYRVESNPDYYSVYDN